AGGRLRSCSSRSTGGPAPTSPPTRSRRRFRSGVARRCGGRSCPWPGRRRSRGWGAPAGSSWGSRTAAPSAQASCSGRAARGSRAGAGRPGRAGRPTNPGPARPGGVWGANRPKCEWVGVPVSQVFDALQYNFGSYYVNNFNEFGRNWQVNVQADPRFRERVRDIRELQVRNSQGQMLPLGTVLSVRATSGPVLVQRYNMYSAAAVTGDVAAGTSTGEAVPLMGPIPGPDLPRAMACGGTQ